QYKYYKMTNGRLNRYKQLNLKPLVNSAPVFGYQSVGNTHCHPNTGALSAIADQPRVKALRRKVAYHWVATT
ncbi:MAG: hypothetical protein LBC02_07080, partial [Planctomycetaceae bacterium]|nr:hypothetical protein [Planctomycetaceae bacterium]